MFSGQTKRMQDNDLSGQRHDVLFLVRVKAGWQRMPIDTNKSITRCETQCSSRTLSVTPGTEILKKQLQKKKEKLPESDNMGI